MVVKADHSIAQDLGTIARPRGDAEHGLVSGNAIRGSSGRIGQRKTAKARLAGINLLFREMTNSECLRIRERIHKIASHVEEQVRYVVSLAGSQLATVGTEVSLCIQSAGVRALELVWGRPRLVQGSLVGHIALLIE